MILFYVKRITDGKMSLEDVPAKWKAEVEKILKVK
nr:MAG TPA: Mating type protein A alpha Y mating type dependent binding region [Caudoviricetes sp.]